MARCKVGPVITDIWGSVGRLTFSNWKGLPTLGMKAGRVSNPQTISQVQMRKLLKELGAKWRQMSTEEKQAWDAYAENNPGRLDPCEEINHQGSKGQLMERDSSIISGFNQFVQHHMIAVETDTTLDIPGTDQFGPGEIPSIGTIPSATLTKVTWDPVTGLVVVTGRWPDMNEVLGDPTVEGNFARVNPWIGVTDYYPYKLFETDYVSFTGMYGGTVRGGGGPAVWPPTFFYALREFRDGRDTVAANGDIEPHTIPFKTGQHVRHQVRIDETWGIKGAPSNLVFAQITEQGYS